MPNISSLQINTPDGYLVKVTFGAGGHAEITMTEAQAYVDGHPNWTDARLESWAVQQMQARWLGRTDQVFVHIFQRAPLVVTALVADAGVTVPANWWAG